MTALEQSMTPDADMLDELLKGCKTPDVFLSASAIVAVTAAIAEYPPVVIFGACGSLR